MSLAAAEAGQLVRDRVARSQSPWAGGLVGYAIVRSARCFTTSLGGSCAHTTSMSFRQGRKRSSFPMRMGSVNHHLGEGLPPKPYKLSRYHPPPDLPAITLALFHPVLLVAASAGGSSWSAILLNRYGGTSDVPGAGHSWKIRGERLSVSGGRLVGIGAAVRARSFTVDIPVDLTLRLECCPVSGFGLRLAAMPRRVRRSAMLHAIVTRRATGLFRVVSDAAGGRPRRGCFAGSATALARRGRSRPQQPAPQQTPNQPSIGFRGKSGA